MTTPNKEQYLGSICRLGGERGAVGLSALADAMGVSPVSTHEMVKKLAGLGLVAYEPYRGVTLTDEGRIEALRLIRRHRLWERFLTDVLDLPWDQVHAEACRLEHATSALVERRLARLLREPEACPHGHPVPTTDGRLTLETGCPMTDLAAGDRGTVLRVPESDSALLAYLADLGLEPGTRLHVLAIAPFEGPLTVRIGATGQVVGHGLAAQIIVRKDPTPEEARDE